MVTIELEDIEVKTLLELLPVDMARLDRIADDHTRSAHTCFSASYHRDVLGWILEKLKATEEPSLTPPADEYLDSNGVAA